MALVLSLPVGLKRVGRDGAPIGLSSGPEIHNSEALPSDGSGTGGSEIGTGATSLSLAPGMGSPSQTDLGGLAPRPNARISLYFMGPPTEDRLRLARRADIVEAAELPPEARSELLDAGVRLMMYDWIFAAYEWDAEGYRPGDFLVSFDGPYGRALAYDYGSEGLRRRRVLNLLDALADGGYSAVFFDWFPAACSEEWASEVPGYVEAFRERHPNQTLWEALREFLLELREGAEERGIDLVIVSNQAYRCGHEPMEYVDWDISESYYSDVVQGATVLFPWDGSSWESPAMYVPELVVRPYEEARRRNPELGFFHLSYALPDRGGREAAFYSFAGARVFGHDGAAYAPSEVEGEVQLEDLPNLYWLGCWRGSTFGDRWAIGVYDAGLVAVGQAPATVPEGLVGAWALDLYDGVLLELPSTLDFGRDPWGRVFLLMAKEGAEIRCTSWELEVPVYGEVARAAMETIAAAGGCEVRIHALSRRGALELWSEWREPGIEVAILSNDIDWNLTGTRLADEIRQMGVEVRRARLDQEGLRLAMLDSKVLILLGGPESPHLGDLLRPLTRALGGPGIYDLGPGRVLIWLWGEDRFSTRKYALDNLDVVRETVIDLISPIPRCHQMDGLTYDPPTGSDG